MLSVAKSASTVTGSAPMVHWWWECTLQGSGMTGSTPLGKLQFKCTLPAVLWVWARKTKSRPSLKLGCVSQPSFWCHYQCGEGVQTMVFARPPIERILAVPSPNNWCFSSKYQGFSQSRYTLKCGLLFFPMPQGWELWFLSCLIVALGVTFCPLLRLCLFCHFLCDLSITCAEGVHLGPSFSSR